MIFIVVKFTVRSDRSEDWLSLVGGTPWPEGGTGNGTGTSGPARTSGDAAS